MNLKLKIKHGFNFNANGNGLEIDRVEEEKYDGEMGGWVNEKSEG